MTILDWSKLTEGELTQKAKSLAPEAIPQVVIALNEQHTPSWKELTRTLILALENKPQLEAAGKALSIEQCLELFAFFPNAVRKLSPLIFGLSHEIFRAVLMRGDENQLLALKQQSMAEPIQHQMTVYSHQLQTRLKELNVKYEDLDFKIEEIQPPALQPEALRIIWLNLCSLSEQYFEMIREINILLLLVWNTDRTDLIENLTNIKEQCHRVSRFGVGFPGTEKEAATGLFERLDTKLFSIYGNPQKSSDGLSNEEPAIEGLAKLSLRYLQDYLNIGLLPPETQLDLDSSHTEAERTAYRDVLWNRIVTTLSELGLKTVKDLKDSWIYSQQSLIEYIKSHQ